MADSISLVSFRIILFSPRLSRSEGHDMQLDSNRRCLKGRRKLDASEKGKVA
jgi:hypothetical protein